MHQLMAATLDEVLDEIRAIQHDARARRRERPAALADDRPAHAQGLDRARRRSTACKIGGHLARAPGAARRHGDEARAPEAARKLDEELPAARSCSTQTGALSPEIAALAPTATRRMGANPHANGGLLLRDLRPAGLRRLRRRRADSPGSRAPRRRACMGEFLRDVMQLKRGPRNFRLFGPDETASNRLARVFEVTDRAWDGAKSCPMTITSRRTAA